MSTGKAFRRTSARGCYLGSPLCSRSRSAQSVSFAALLSHCTEQSVAPRRTTGRCYVLLDHNRLACSRGILPPNHTSKFTLDHQSVFGCRLSEFQAYSRRPIGFPSHSHPSIVPPSISSLSCRPTQERQFLVSSFRRREENSTMVYPALHELCLGHLRRDLDRTGLHIFTTSRRYRICHRRHLDFPPSSYHRLVARRV